MSDSIPVNNVAAICDKNTFTSSHRSSLEGRVLVDFI